jgi:PAS domain S-box-containing protein
VLFEAAGLGVAQVDAHTGKFLLVNQMCCEILGYPREELIGRRWEEISLPEEVPGDQARIDALLVGKTRSFSREKRYLRKDGTILWARLTVSRAWADGEQPTYQVALLEDITARKDAESALLATQAELRGLTAELEHRVAERTAELSRAARAKDEFLASMSHELRTPLNGILGLAEALGDEVYGSLVTRQGDAVRRIGESGRHLLALITDILDVAKVEAGKVELSCSAVSFADLCSASLRLVAEPARRKRLTVEVDLPVTPPLVADERRLKQVLVNLLTNAVKFTPEGGRIGLQAAVDERDASLRVVVWDTGIGIAEADLPRLFQPFVQLDSRLAREHAGTGLGLALVRRLLALHGGEVRVESQLGKGSRFIVRLPLVPPGESAEPASAKAPPATLRSPLSGGMLVLVADDDENNLSLLRDVLGHHGYVVREARDGRDAVSQAAALRPQVILMDVQMPHLDGLGAIRAIRANPAIAQTPVIALTALAMPGDEERCRAAGADDYLAKPIAIRRLLGVMDRLTGRAPKG